MLHGCSIRNDLSRVTAVRVQRLCTRFMKVVCFHRCNASSKISITRSFSDVVMTAYLSPSSVDCGLVLAHGCSRCHIALSIVDAAFSNFHNQGNHSTLPCPLHLLTRRNIGGHSLNSHAQKVTYSDAGNYHSGGGERLISFYSPPGVRGVGPSDMTMLSAVSVPVTLHNADPGFGGVSGNLITCDRTIETVGFCSPGVGLARDSFGGGYMTNVTGTGSRAVAVASTTGVAVNVKERRTQRDSWGEDDLEFLRSLAEADCPPPDHGNHPALPQAPVTLYPPQMNSQPQAATMFRTSNLPGIQTAVPSARDVFSSSREPPPVRITAENREAARNFPRQDDNCTTEVTEEEKLHAADYVAMLLWRAGPQLRDRLLSRVNDTWARVERELEAARDAAAQLSRHDRPVAHGAAELALCAGKSFKELLMERLEETQRVVEADLKAADEEAALMGGTATTCKAPQWLGAKALRGDIREKLKQYQTRVRDQKKAEITANAMAAKARGETNDYFVKVLEQTRQELYMQASENGIQPLDHDAKLEEIDRITEGLLEQLDANHRAVQEELTPVKGPLPSNFRDGLLERLNATRAVAKAQLTAADAAAVTSDGVILGYGATVNNVPGVSAPVPVSAVRGLRVMGDVSDESDSLAVHATAGTSGQAQDQADVNTKEDGTPVKKRKRKSGGGRRCKHEGW